MLKLDSGSHTNDETHLNPKASEATILVVNWSALYIYISPKFTCGRHSNPGLANK